LIEYNFDGEIHPLNNDFAYIAKTLDGNIDLKEDSQEWSLFLDEYLKKYIDYLMKHDQEKCKKMLFYYLYGQFPYATQDYMVIFKPPWKNNIGVFLGSLSLKFKRAPNDGLDDAP
jgi:hypothetical protein